MKRVAVILSGCGNKDGAEITESVATLVALSQYGAQYEVFAPSMKITPVNFLTGKALDQEKRDILLESARIARGHINELSALKEKEFDALVFPGGYGAALHLSNWAHKGAQCEVLPEVARVINEFHGASKPIGAICIAPVLLAKVLGKKKIALTLGAGREAIAEVQKTGVEHVECPVEDFITDRFNKVLSTPAYMYDDAKPHQVFNGINKMIKELVELA